MAVVQTEKGSQCQVDLELQGTLWLNVTLLPNWIVQAQLTHAQEHVCTF